MLSSNPAHPDPAPRSPTKMPPSDLSHKGICLSLAKAASLPGPKKTKALTWQMAQHQKCRNQLPEVVQYSTSFRASAKAHINKTHTVLTHSSGLSGCGTCNTHREPVQSTMMLHSSSHWRQSYYYSGLPKLHTVLRLDTTCLARSHIFSRRMSTHSRVRFAQEVPASVLASRMSSSLKCILERWGVVRT